MVKLRKKNKKVIREEKVGNLRTSLMKKKADQSKGTALVHGIWVAEFWRLLLSKIKMNWDRCHSFLWATGHWMTCFTWFSSTNTENKTLREIKYNMTFSAVTGKSRFETQEYSKMHHIYIQFNMKSKPGVLDTFMLTTICFNKSELSRRRNITWENASIRVRCRAFS